MKKFLFAALILAASIPNLSFAADAILPKVCVVATGGTIAGKAAASVTTAYQPSVLSVEDIIASVDGVEELAQIEAIQFSNISSQNMSSAKQLELAQLVNELLDREDVAGVVITHGTDTMEESAYLLSLVCDSEKPTIFVAAMRPSSALGADGPANLYSAISTAASPKSEGRGVMVVMNDQIFSPRDVTKGNTQNTAAFYAPNSSAIGVVTNGKPLYLHDAEPLNRFEFSDLPKSLPAVAVLYGYVDADSRMVDAAVDLRYKGIVFCGVGHGNMDDVTLNALVEARKNGVAVVRSSRVVAGLVTSDGEVDDDALGFTASGLLNPAKAKILMSLALHAADGNVERANEIFEQNSGL